MISRFDLLYKNDLINRDAEFDGTKLGHSNNNSDRESDINVHWNDNRLAFDLSDNHLMFEVSEVPGTGMVLRLVNHTEISQNFESTHCLWAS